MSPRPVGLLYRLRRLQDRFRTWTLPWRFRFVTWRFHRRLTHIIQVEHELAQRCPDWPGLHRVLCTRPDCDRTAVEVFQVQMVWPAKLPLKVVTRCSYHRLARDTANDFQNDGRVVIEAVGCS